MTLGLQLHPRTWTTWRAAVVAALTQYTVDGGSWDDVVTAFVDGWATQYAKDNG